METKSVEKKTVTVHRHDGEPVTVTVDVEPGQAPRVTTHAIQAAPMIAALGGGPRLGVEIRDLGKEDLAKFKLATPNGVVVEQVTSASAAEKAGVKAGDVVVQFDGENVRSAAQFTRLVRETVAGRAVKMGVVRDGKRVDLDVAPAEAESVFDLQVTARGRSNSASSAGCRPPAARSPGRSGHPRPDSQSRRSRRCRRRRAAVAAADADAGPGRRCHAVLWRGRRRRQLHASRPAAGASA